MTVKSCGFFYLILTLLTCDMATIDEVYKLTQYRANKSNFTGNISPADFNLLFPRAEIRYYNTLYAQYYKNQRISDSLSRFMTDPIPITIDSAGKYTLPNDVFHVDSITATFNGVQYPIVRVEKDRLGSHLSSVYDAPSAQFPIYTEFKTFLQFYPINLNSASLVYLKQPVKSVWGYTLVSNRPVYSSGTSVQPVWSDTDIDNIIYLLLQDIGINMRDPLLSQFAQVEQQTQK